MPPRPRKSPPKPYDAARLWTYALNALGRRALSEGEIRIRLARRAASPADVDAVIARLSEYGYLDDRRFAEQFTLSRIENQSFGSRRVVRDLRARRVPPPTAAEAVRQAYQDRDEDLLIEQFIERRFRKVDLSAYLADPSHLASAYRKLLMAGFGGAASIRVLRRFTQRADDLDPACQMEEDGPAAG